MLITLWHKLVVLLPNHKLKLVKFIEILLRQIGYNDERKNL